MNPLKKEIWNIDLGQPPKEIKGHEQAYKRPCLILKPFSNLKLAIIIPITSKKQSIPYYTIVQIPKGQGGLTKESYALCHQIRTVSFDRLISKRGTIDITNFNKVVVIIKDILEL